MSKTIKKFDFDITKMSKNESMPFDPHIDIYLDHFSHKKNGPPLVAQNLMTDEEIDTNIKLLHEDLEAVGNRAKRALKKATAEAKNWTQS